MQKLRVKVYEEQWGGFVADYVTYFDNMKDLKQFQKETGFKTEVLEIVTF